MRAVSGKPLASVEGPGKTPVDGRFALACAPGSERAGPTAAEWLTEGSARALRKARDTSAQTRRRNNDPEEHHANDPGDRRIPHAGHAGASPRQAGGVNPGGRHRDGRRARFAIRPDGGHGRCAGQSRAFDLALGHRPSPRPSSVRCGWTWPLGRTRQRSAARVRSRAVGAWRAGDAPLRSLPRPSPPTPDAAQPRPRVAPTWRAF